MFYRESIGIIPSRRLTTKTMIRLHDVQADLRICYSRMAKDRFSHDLVTGYHAQPLSGAISPVLCLSERTGEGSSDAVCMRRLAFVNHLSYKCNIHMSWLE